MILRQATIKYSGTDPDSLKLKSNKKICCSCDNCGKVRWVVFNAYRDLCLSCSKSNKNHHLYRKHHSNETKRKISEGNKGKIVSDRTKQKLSKSHTGIKLTQITKDKIGLYHKNKILSNETKEKISKSRMGFKHSEETKQKMQEVNSGKNNGMFNKHHSLESRIKLSCAQQNIDIKNFSGFIKKNRNYILPEKDCIKLNNRFKGSHFHHILKDLGIYIPGELHNHIKHDIRKGENMGEMNALAIQFINGGLNE